MVYQQKGYAFIVWEADKDAVPPGKVLVSLSWMLRCVGCYGYFGWRNKIKKEEGKLFLVLIFSPCLIGS